MHNGERWIEGWLSSVRAQQFNGRLQVSVFDDGSTDGTDMLAGHTAFKSSLDHEYVGVLAHFADVLRGRGAVVFANGPPG